MYRSYDAGREPFYHQKDSIIQRYPGIDVALALKLENKPPSELFGTPKVITTAQIVSTNGDRKTENDGIFNAKVFAVAESSSVRMAKLLCNLKERYR